MLPSGDLLNVSSSLIDGTEERQKVTVTKYINGKKTIVLVDAEELERKEKEVKESSSFSSFKKKKRESSVSNLELPDDFTDLMKSPAGKSSSRGRGRRYSGMDLKMKASDNNNNNNDDATPELSPVRRISTSHSPVIIKNGRRADFHESSSKRESGTNLEVPDDFTDLIKNPTGNNTGGRGPGYSSGMGLKMKSASDEQDSGVAHSPESSPGQGITSATSPHSPVVIKNEHQVSNNPNDGASSSSSDNLYNPNKKKNVINPYFSNSSLSASFESLSGDESFIIMEDEEYTDPTVAAKLNSEVESKRKHREQGRKEKRASIKMEDLMSPTAAVAGKKKKSTGHSSSSRKNSLSAKLDLSDDSLTGVHRSGSSDDDTSVQLSPSEGKKKKKNSSSSKSSRQPQQQNEKKYNDESPKIATRRRSGKRNKSGDLSGSSGEFPLPLSDDGEGDTDGKDSNHKAAVHESFVTPGRKSKKKLAAMSPASSSPASLAKWSQNSSPTDYSPHKPVRCSVLAPDESSKSLSSGDFPLPLSDQNDDIEATTTPTTIKKKKKRSSKLRKSLLDILPPKTPGQKSPGGDDASTVVSGDDGESPLATRTPSKLRMSLLDMLPPKTPGQKSPGRDDASTVVSGDDGESPMTTRTPSKLRMSLLDMLPPKTPGQKSPGGDDASTVVSGDGESPKSTMTSTKKKKKRSSKIGKSKSSDVLSPTSRKRLTVKLDSLTSSSAIEDYDDDDNRELLYPDYSYSSKPHSSSKSRRGSGLRVQDLVSPPGKKSKKVSSKIKRRNSDAILSPRHQKVRTSLAPTLSTESFSGDDDFFQLEEEDLLRKSNHGGQNGANAVKSQEPVIPIYIKVHQDRLKEIEARLAELEEETKEDIEAMKKSHERKKMDFKESATRSYATSVVDEEKKFKEIKESGQSMIEYLNRENQNLIDQTIVIKKDKAMVNKQKKVLEGKKNLLDKDNSSLQAFIDRKLKSKKKHEESAYNCEHRYIPNHQTEIEESKRHGDAEHKLKELYKTMVHRVADAVQRQSTDPEFTSEILSMVLVCQQEVEEIVQLRVPEEMEAWTREVEAEVENLKKKDKEDGGSGGLGPT